MAMKVAIIMGSKSDWGTGKDAYEQLREFGVETEVRVISAHRAHDVLVQYAREFEERGIRVAIAIAGGAAHLPGVLASLTTIPVIGVPVSGGISLNGLDSLLSIVQMPPGIPVATVGINNGRNAALLAISILALLDNNISQKLKEYRVKMKQKVISDDASLQSELLSQG